jgi:hypothetical protein
VRRNVRFVAQLLVIRDELVTPNSPDRSATRTAFRGLVSHSVVLRMERVMGIEPTLAAWEAAVLPLNYTRLGSVILFGLLRSGQPRPRGRAPALTIHHRHHLLAVPRPGNLLARERRIELCQLVPGESQLRGCDVFLEIAPTLGARDRHHVLALMQ